MKDDSYRTRVHEQGFEIWYPQLDDNVSLLGAEIRAAAERKISMGRFCSYPCTSSLMVSMDISFNVLFFSVNKNYCL